MKRFDHTRLWAVFRTLEQTTDGSNPKAIFDEFVDEVSAYCRAETSLAERTRTLSYVRSEFRLYLDEQRCGTKKNVPLRRIIRQAVYFIENEIDLVKMELAHPERFITFPSDSAPLIRWGASTADLIEYTIGPQAAGILQLPSGKPMNFEEAVIFLEKIFGITIPQFYDRRTKILDRQKNTAFQDEMRRIFLEEAKKRSK
jgi:hypothetical protein